MQACKAFPTDGTSGTSTGNSLQCRVTHVDLAVDAGTQATHCPQASEWGGNGCGSVCNAYCNQFTGMGTCQYYYPNTFASRAECENTFCERYPLAIGGMPANGVVTGGNSKECRQYHSFAAVVANATGNMALAMSHCTHAMPSSATGTCVNGTGSPADAITDVYCENHIRACGVTTAGAEGYSPSTAKWSGRTECLAVAAQFPRGAQNDQTSDTIQCRNYHANVAGSSPSLQALHCAHSGLNGIDQCGTSPCESYCDNILLMCTSGNAQYQDKASCMLWCSALPAGTDGATTGDSLACRLYHLQVAASLGSATQGRADHCTHAGAGGAGQCGTPQEAFCDVAIKACNSSATASPYNGLAQYASKAACAQQAMAYPRTTPGVTSGNSLECRAYHASVALSGAAGGAVGHCFHTGQLGGLGVCGTGCEGFCATAGYACNGTNMPFSTTDECLKYCATFPVSGNQIPGTATSGNSLECRSYHVGVALISPAAVDKTAHCSHARAVSASNTCGTACDAYCNTWIGGCNATYTSKYSSWADCTSKCATWSAGTAGAASGNTLACRQYHAGVALLASGTTRNDHCGHSYATSTGNCVDGAGSSSGGNGASALQASVGLVAAAIIAAIAL